VYYDAYKFSLDYRVNDNTKKIHYRGPRKFI